MQTDGTKRFRDLEIHQTFPVCISKFKLDRDLTPFELGHIRDLERQDLQANQFSLAGNVLDGYWLKDLKAFLDDCLWSHIQTVHDSEIEGYITQSWATYTKKGGYQQRHYHSNSFISGVFYVQTSEDDSITFYNPRDKFLNIEGQAPYVQEVYTFPAVAGEALLFPSYLHHSVGTHSGDSQRISISFNSFVKGELGVDLGKTYLDLR